MFEPLTEVFSTFRTPIRQIASISFRPGQIGEYNSNALAIRTFESTSIFNIDEHLDAPSRIKLVEKAIIDSSDTGGRPIVDVKISPGPISGVVVNDRGAIYRVDFGEGWKSVSVTAAIFNFILMLKSSFQSAGTSNTATRFSI